MCIHTHYKAIKHRANLANTCSHVHAYRYNEATKVLEGLARDFEHRDVSASGFIINAQKLLFAATDAGGTLWQYEYAKHHPLSWGGQRLLPGGSLHMGHTVTKLSAVKVGGQARQSAHTPNPGQATAHPPLGAQRVVLQAHGQQLARAPLAAPQLSGRADITSYQQMQEWMREVLRPQGRYACLGSCLGLVGGLFDVKRRPLLARAHTAACVPL